ncbi:unnamed protein product, partial [Didymodactylos carnosus]
DDVFDVFKLDSRQFDEMKEKHFFKLRNGQYVVKPGIASSLSFLTKLLKAKQEEQQSLTDDGDQQERTNDFINNHPLLKSLVSWYQHNDNDNNKNDCKHSYHDSVKKFAAALYILGGKQAYQFVRLNLYGSLPSLTTLNAIIMNTHLKIDEGNFRFDLLEQHFDSPNTKFCFLSEDCTGVIRKVKYDTTTNSFVGFTTPLKNGIPIPQYYKTESFEELKFWFDTIEKAPLLNVHMVQPIPSSSDERRVPIPFLLGAYGVTSKFTANDVLHRWMFIFENSFEKEIRIIGFSTDADNKYMRAMRLASGFFASLPHFKFHDHLHLFKIQLPSQWSWFYLRPQQLLLFFQDPIHLVTKWRNRLLSTTADLCLGQDRITMEHLRDILNSDQYTKLDHGLTKSDLNPKDRQNYSSSVKLVSNDLLNLLADRTDAHGTLVYLQSLKMIITAYIEKSTTITERLESSWCLVFVCRLWWSWTKNLKVSKPSKTTTVKTNKKMNSNGKYFITKPAYLSVEINAHNLLYLVLLVQQKQLPKEALNIYLFNSQACESTFRNTRSLSGAFSTIVNFTVNDFLRRSQKLSMLNKMKCDQSNESLLFPVHHKHRQDTHLLSTLHLEDIDELDIEQIILNAYYRAINLIQHSKISALLKERGIFALESLSNYVYKQLNTNSRLFDYSTQTTNDDSDELELDEDEDDADDTTNSDAEDNEELLESIGETGDNIDEEVMTSIKSTFSGINIVDKVSPHLNNSYFKIKINEDWQYLHKESACWILTDTKAHSSSDRLSRVIETGQNDQ